VVKEIEQSDRGAGVVLLSAENRAFRGFERTERRALDPHDEIGLLRPGGRTGAGYRRYEDPDLERLQQILFYRELGFSLEQIAAILDDSEAGATEHLRRQHRLLTERIAHLELMVAAIEREMEAHKMGIQLTPEERFEVFGDFDPDEHAQEAEERWGGTDAYKESQRRVARYSKQDWLTIKAEGEDISLRFAAAMTSGAGPASDTAVELAEEHRQYISRWFYECSYEIHRGLGEMYVADSRFTATYEAIAEGLARYISDAIRANAARA
jgi:MerR family transcriptional regulator, thiopeptide resistance regulator